MYLDPLLLRSTSRNTQMPGIYEYERLSDEKRQIRLLKPLDPGSPTHRQQYSLQTWDLDKAPAYAAVSYVWGDSLTSCQICLDGRTLAITRNCSYVLEQISRMPDYADLHLWVDAVSMDQHDTKEKGHQVQLMGAIYENAKVTLACVGPDADDSEFLINFCHEVALHPDFEFKRVSDFERPIDNIDEIASKLRLNPTRDRAYLRKLASRLDAAYQAFLGRTFWTRLWVIQELWLSKKTDLLCGSSRAISPTVLLAAMFNFAAHLYGRKNTRETYLLGNVENDSNMQRLIFSMLNPSYKRLLPWHAMHITKGWKCSDFRDQVYSLIHIIEWDSDLGKPVPDYQLTKMELVAQFLHHACGDRRLYWMELLRLAEALDLRLKDVPSGQYADERRFSEFSQPFILGSLSNTYSLQRCLVTKIRQVQLGPQSNTRGLQPSRVQNIRQIKSDDGDGACFVTTTPLRARSRDRCKTRKQHLCHAESDATTLRRFQETNTIGYVTSQAESPGHLILPYTLGPRSFGCHSAGHVCLVTSSSSFHSWETGKLDEKLLPVVGFAILAQDLDKSRLETCEVHLSPMDVVSLMTFQHCLDQVNESDAPRSLISRILNERSSGHSFYREDRPEILRSIPHLDRNLLQAH